MRRRGAIALQASSICLLDRFWSEDGEALADEVASSEGLLGMVTTGLGDVDRPLVAPLQDQLDRFFHLAEQRDLAIDLHLDETGDKRACTLRMVAETALRRNFRKPIQVGHCCALALQDDDEAAETIRLCAEAGLTVVVLPMVNIYLQGRAAGRTPRWRGVTLVHELRAAGVPVSFASDNCRDPFYAFGDYDMLEVYREAVRIGHLDHPFGDWAGSVTAVPNHWLSHCEPASPCLLSVSLRRCPMSCSRAAATSEPSVPAASARAPACRMWLPIVTGSPR